MHRGVEGWHKKIDDGAWKTIPNPTKVKVDDKEMYHFRNNYYEEYVKMV